MSKEIKALSVDGMSCEHCVKAIKGAVGALNGVDTVSVDLDSKKVTVEFDPEKVTTGLIRDAIEDQGYDVAD
jgi:copper ion binding protein